MTPLTRADAIQAMARGEKCETYCLSVWRPTKWLDFDFSGEIPYQFRRPPEPRRVAIEVWVNLENWQVFSVPRDGRTLFREVLPGDVTLQRKTEADVNAEFNKSKHAHMPFMFEGWLASLRAFGLIGEGS